MDVVIKLPVLKHNSERRLCVLCGLVWDITKRKSCYVQSALAVCGPTFCLHCTSSLEVSKPLYYISNWTTLEKPRDVVVAVESSLRPPSVFLPPMVETWASPQKGGQSFCFAAVSFSALQTLWALHRTHRPVQSGTPCSTRRTRIFVHFEFWGGWDYLRGPGIASGDSQYIKC